MLDSRVKKIVTILEQTKQSETDKGIIKGLEIAIELLKNKIR